LIHNNLTCIPEIISASLRPFNANLLKTFVCIFLWAHTNSIHEKIHIYNFKSNKGRRDFHYQPCPPPKIEDIMKSLLKAGNATPEETAVSRQLLCKHTLPQQQIHECNNGGTVGGGVLRWVHAEAIYWGLKQIVFCVSKSWKPLICSLKKPPEHDAGSTRLCTSMHP
jgi:hypothetical protein